MENAEDIERFINNFDVFLIDLDANEKVLISTRINPAIYGKYIVITKRAVGDPNLNKNPVFFKY